MSDRSESSEGEYDAPRLTAALRALHPSPPPMPRSVDDAIRAAARAHLRALVPSVPSAVHGPNPRATMQDRAAHGRLAPFPRFFPFPKVAMAAAFVLGLGLTYLFRPSPGLPIAREDIDRNGQVDILDAFALARRLQSPAPSGGDQALDINGDGLVDQRDVDAVAARAVKVTKG